MAGRHDLRGGKATRVFGAAWAFVVRTDSLFDPEALHCYLRAYQLVQPLTSSPLRSEFRFPVQTAVQVLPLFSMLLQIMRRSRPRLRRLSRIHRRHHDLPLVAQYLERHVVAVPAQHQVHDRLAKTQVAQGHLLEKLRQPRVVQQDFVAVRIEFETEGRLQEQKRRASGPGLRRAGDWIERRPALAPALEAAIQFG